MKIRLYPHPIAASFRWYSRHTLYYYHQCWSLCGRRFRFCTLEARLGHTITEYSLS
jgi:hypothetical protein